MKNLSRRSFLKSSAVAGTGIVFIPNFISAQPSNQLRIAMIGVGGQGRASWSQVPVESLVAMVDVDDRMSQQAKQAVPNAKWYYDYRKMFDEMKNEIDAVMIATPDHSHFPAAMTAMELGKHVLVEKPLAHNIWQLRTLKKAAKHYKVVSQMANQGHTTHGIRQVKEWYEADVLGQVREVIAWQGPINYDRDAYFTKPDSFPPAGEAVPNGLNWDLWQGPVAERPFNNVYVPRTWRGFYDYGNGKLGDWCCHTLDAPYWALDLGVPESAEAELKNPVSDHSFISDESIVTWKFGARGDKAPVTMKWYEGFGKPEARPEWGVDELPGSGMIMIGDKKTLITGVRPERPRLLVSEEESEAFMNNLPAQKYPRIAENKPVQEWVDCIKNGTLPGSNFDYSASFMEACQFGILAQRVGGKIEYDAENMKVKGRPDLDKYIKEPMREGWVHGENI